MIAEIAIAFLGFTGVVGVFTERGESVAVSLRIWVMVEVGLALLLLAMLPFVLHHLGQVETATWTLCGFAALIFLSAHLLLVVPRIVRHRRAGEFGHVPRALEFSFPILFVAAFCSQVLTLLGVGLEGSSGGYLLVLYLLLAASGVNFISLLYLVRSSEKRSA